MPENNAAKMSFNRGSGVVGDVGSGDLDGLIEFRSEVCQPGPKNNTNGWSGSLLEEKISRGMGLLGERIGNGSPSYENSRDGCGEERCKRASEYRPQSQGRQILPSVRSHRTEPADLNCNGRKIGEAA